ncbi:MAG: tetratricopeptide repeat protein [Myxococcota bacterium]
MRPWLALGLLLGCGKKTPPVAPAETVVNAPTEGTFDPNAPLADKLALAIEKIQSGTVDDLTLAVAILTQCLPEDPGGATELNLGIALQKLGKLAEAVPRYDTVLAMHPDWAEAWVYKGSALEQLDRPNQAVSVYRDALGVDSENMGARVALIQVLRTLGRPDDAIAEAKAALKVNASSLPVYNNFALAYLDKGEMTLARFILQKALQSVEGASANAYLHTNLGWSHYLDGNKPAAIQSLLKAVELEPDLVPALVYLATVYLEDRNYGDMIPLLETALKQDPDNPDVHLNLGIAYRGMERFDEAKQAYETALKLAPESPDPWFNLGILLGDSLKEYEASVAAFNRYLDAGGAEPERAQTYIAAVNKERETAERRAKAEAARKQRELERQREQELLRQTEGDATAEPPPTEAPDEAPPPDPQEETP